VPALALVSAAAIDAVYDRGPAHIVIVAACLVAALLLRPRFGTVGRAAVTVNAGSAPQLFHVISRIARSVAASPPSVVVLDDSFTAGSGVVGVRRRRVLSLGLPLWTVLEDDERIALLAHEIAHDVDGDPARRVVIGRAGTTFSTTHQLPAPGPFVIGQHAANQYIWREGVYRALLRGAAGVARAVRAAAARVLYPSDRSNEYVADDIAIRVASMPAWQGLLEKTLMRDYVDFALAHAASGGHEALWAAGRRTLDEVPPRERERLRRLAALRGECVDASHPPTALRLRFAATRPTIDPDVRAEEGQFRAVDSELAGPYTRVAASMRDRLTS
jgi:Zn-dependent protease with chaperone function